MVSHAEQQMVNGALFTEEEATFLRDKMPTLAGGKARRFLDRGRWVDEQEGFFLTLEGEDVGRLIYLHSGRADVQLQGKTVGSCVAGNFIGEITCLDGGPATATSVLTEDARYFTIDAPNLKKLCFADPELRLHLERAMALDTRTKLKAANAALTAATQSKM